VGEFDQCILMHILPCLYYSISFICLHYFLCFNVFSYFILFLHLINFRIYFPAFAAFTNKFITGAWSIGLKRATSRWKAKKKIYNFRSEVES
jgi:hypothetical protein